MVRLIGPDGEQVGIVSSREAQKIADEAGLDLVKIAPNAKPPVCKVIDYGKYRYELARKEKDAKKKQKIVELKEIPIMDNVRDRLLRNQADEFREHSFSFGVCPDDRARGSNPAGGIRGAQDKPKKRTRHHRSVHESNQRMRRSRADDTQRIRHLFHQYMYFDESLLHRL